MTKQEAYDFGYSCGKHGSNTINSHFSIFATKENTAAWEKGKRDAEAEITQQSKLVTDNQHLDEWWWRPRYIVIDKYPDAIADPGTVLKLKYNDQRKQYEYHYAQHNGMSGLGESFFNEYPNLFRKLHWSEYLEEDMIPKYVENRKGKIYELTKGMLNAGIVVMEDYLPATEQMYNNQKAKNI